MSSRLSFPRMLLLSLLNVVSVGIPHAIFAGSAHKRDRGAIAAEFNARCAQPPASSVFSSMNPSSLTLKPRDQVSGHTG